ncbi:cytochrome P450 family protein [Nocardia bovistercoris]|uniref:Cytochrome P450 n=1 Tax=Nocardia bovistercoris TaxID=2785916 RepID=A0A931I8B1_9NOCA|nr:cytochrome P450 [Nocardia bovistercoris]MBH0776514.1 cytochrome P450 [Nocardia bovistercoris]
MIDTDAEDRIITLDGDFFADPHAHYRRWRANGAVHPVRFPDGVVRWVVIGYAEARAALADPRLRKNMSHIDALLSARREAPPTNPQWLALTSHMLHSDPPEHTRLRKLVNKSFTARAVAELRPRVERIADDLLDAMAAAAETDLMEAFAVPLPVTVICELLGVPYGDRADFTRWTRDLIGIAGREAERGRAAMAMVGYLGELVATKQREPADDLLSALAAAHEDGDRLSSAELVSMAFLLLVAGHETTVNLIGNGVYALLRDPVQLAALRADPSMIPGAVEELLRFDGPVDMATVRYTAEPVSLGGVEIPEGELVYVAVTAANRDPDRFRDPDTLDIAGDSSHLSFGHGIHFCVGAPLARMEATVAFAGLLRRFPDLALLDGASEPQWQPSTMIRGMLGLPVRLRG